MLLYSLLLLLSNIVIVCFAIKKIIYVSHKKHLFDEPREERKIHKLKTPNLGGVAVFLSLLFTSAFIISDTILNLNYIIAAAVILVTLGLTDDLVGIDPLKKMAAQLLAALITCILADFRFQSLFGFFGFQEINYWFSIFISAFFILFLINAVNLIDGINGLAGSIGLLACLHFSFFFWQYNEPGFLYLSMGMSGCLIGFLFYNFTPARIFMGDTGSLFLGFMLSLFSIRFLEITSLSKVSAIDYFSASSPSIVLAILIIPVFDTLRVFTIRLLNRKSPFTADRNHIHHLLLDLKLSHVKITGILTGVNISVVFLVYLLGTVKPEYTFLIISLYVLVLFRILQFKRSQYKESVFKNRRIRYNIPGISSLNFKGKSAPPVLNKEHQALAEVSS